MYRRAGRALRAALVRREARALLGAARQLVIAVRELDAAVIELEAQRAARIVGVETRERGLRCRVAMQESERRAPSAGPTRAPTMRSSNSSRPAARA